MTKKWLMIIFVILGQIACVFSAEAGLINYERRERIRKQREAQEVQDFQGVVADIDYDELMIMIKNPDGNEERQLKVQDQSVLENVNRYQKVRVRYHPRTRKVHSLKVVADEAR
jgi:hypothetical protein